MTSMDEVISRINDAISIERVDTESKIDELRSADDLLSEVSFNKSACEKLLQCHMDIEHRFWKSLPDHQETGLRLMTWEKNPLGVAYKTVGKFIEWWKVTYSQQVFESLYSVMASSLGSQHVVPEHHFSAIISLEDVDGFRKIAEGDFLLGPAMMMQTTSSLIRKALESFRIGPLNIIPSTLMIPLAMVKDYTPHSHRSYRKWVFFKKSFDFQLILDGGLADTEQLRAELLASIAEKQMQLGLILVYAPADELHLHVAIKKSRNETDEQYDMRKRTILDHIRDDMYMDTSLSQHNWKILRVIEPSPSSLDSSQWVTTLAAAQAAMRASRVSYRPGGF